ncbi:MAG: HepT-like ribonuclease domain-containing protein [Archaeoglobaceae archaeon]
MPEKRDIRLFLVDVSESIERIDDYTSEMTYEDFPEDRKTIDAVVRNFEIIGEASKIFQIISKKNILMLTGRQ